MVWPNTALVERNDFDTAMVALVLDTNDKALSDALAGNSATNPLTSLVDPITPQRIHAEWSANTYDGGPVRVIYTDQYDVQHNELITPSATPGAGSITTFAVKHLISAAKTVVGADAATVTLECTNHVGVIPTIDPTGVDAVMVFVNDGSGGANTADTAQPSVDLTDGANIIVPATAGDAAKVFIFVYPSVTD